MLLRSLSSVQISSSCFDGGVEVYKSVFALAAASIMLPTPSNQIPQGYLSVGDLAMKPAGFGTGRQRGNRDASASFPNKSFCKRSLFFGAAKHRHKYLLIIPD